MDTPILPYHIAIKFASNIIECIIDVSMAGLDSLNDIIIVFHCHYPPLNRFIALVHLELFAILCL